MKTYSALSQNKQKKNVKIVLVLLFGIVCMFLNNNDVKALSSNIELDEQKKVIEETTRIFGNIDIESISYLYNLNASPDYVFVDFKDSGYVIYYRQTLEIIRSALFSPFFAAHDDPGGRPEPCLQS